MKDRKIYIGAFLNIVVGVIFLLAASKSRQVIVVLAIGILSFIKGIMIFTLGLEKMKSLLD